MARKAQAAKETPLQEDQSKTAEIVGTINDMFMNKVEGAKIEIGQYLLDEVFEGKIANALSRDPQKHASFEKICKHPDLNMGVNAGTLSRWVQAAALKRECEESETDTGHLTVSHLAAIARLAQAEDRTGLVKKAVSNKMTVNDLHHHVNQSNVNRRRRQTEIITRRNVDYARLKKRLARVEDLAADGELSQIILDPQLMTKRLSKKERFELCELLERKSEVIEKKLSAIEEKEKRLAEEREPITQLSQVLKQALEKLAQTIVSKS